MGCMIRVLGFDSWGGGAEKFSLHHHIQNGSGAYPDSYPKGTRALFLGVK